MRKLKMFPLAFIALLISVMVAGETKSSSLLASISLHSQDEKAVWEMYTTEGEEFSVLMPELPGVIKNKYCLDAACQVERLDNTYAAYADGVVYMVTSYQIPNRRLSLDEIIPESLSPAELNSPDVKRAEVTLDKFKGRQYILKKSSAYGVYEVLMTFYLTNERVYRVEAIGGSRNDAVIQKFFKSFTLKNGKGKEIGSGGRNSSVPSTPAAPKGEEQGAKANQPPSVFRANEVSQKATIILKPSPEYTEEARQKGVAGTVSLQAVLDSSGRVAAIRTISGLPDGLTEKAIKAARKIYFLPAMKDGKRVSQYIKIEYNFNVY